MHSIAFYSGHQDGKCYVTRITSKHTKEGAMTAAKKKYSEMDATGEFVASIIRARMKEAGLEADPTANANVLLREWVKVTKELMAK